MKETYDILIIGGGPGGYVAAIRAAQLGFNVCLVDKSQLGGVCLNWGCIPTKALLKSAEIANIIKKSSEYGIEVKDYSFDFKKIIARSREIANKLASNIEILIKKNKVIRKKGFAKFKDRNTVELFDENNNFIEELSAKNIIIAVGAKTKNIPNIKIDKNVIITSSEAMILSELPKDMIIIGAGAIGVEFAYFYNSLGTKVTLVEMMPQILPTEDIEISQTLEKIFKKNGIEIITNAKALLVEKEGDKGKCLIEVLGEQKTLYAEKILSAIGVEPNTENLGLEKIGIETEKGWIKVNKKNYQTNINNIYAIGDVIGPPWLAHVASAEGINCVEKIKGLHNYDINYENIPGCVYCQPQVASIGLTEKKANELGYEIKIGKFPFMASGKAFAIGEREGFVKIIFDSKYGEILGAHIIGPEATEILAELGLAKSLEADFESIVKTIHAHPTLSESIMEAAAQAYGEAIHI